MSRRIGFPNQGEPCACGDVEWWHPGCYKPGARMDAMVLRHAAITTSDWLAGGCDIHDIPRMEIAGLAAFTKAAMKSALENLTTFNERNPMKATIGRTVIIKNCHSNGADEQPAVITRVWSQHGTEHGPVSINVMVLPDGGEPTNLSSVMLYHDRAAAEAVLAVSEGKPFVAFWPDRV